MATPERKPVIPATSWPGQMNNNRFHSIDRVSEMIFSDLKSIHDDIGIKMTVNWTSDAEKAVNRAPFFVRKRIKKRVEEDAAKRGVSLIDIDFVNAAKKRFLSNMEEEVTGHSLDVCFGKDGCPNKAVSSENLAARLDALFASADLLGFLKARVKGKLKFHHVFRVTIAECPNGCSQPQIKDIGVIGASAPAVTGEACTFCEACVTACRENAVSLIEGAGPKIDINACLYCGACFRECPSGTLTQGKTGYRVQLGGKLGRRPRLGLELNGIFTDDEVVEIAKAAIDFYKKNSASGERFGALFTDEAFHDFNRRFGKKK